MSVTITVVGDNAAHATQELCNFIKTMHVELLKMTNVPAPTPVDAPSKAETAVVAAGTPEAKASVETVTASDTPTSGDKKPAKGKKAAAEAPKAPPPQPVNIDLDETATLDNARAWIQAVHAKFGLDEAAKIITSFGVKKVGEIKAESFGDFISKCKTLLTAEPAATPKASVADMM